MGEQGLHACTPHGDRALRCGRRTGIFTALPVPRTGRGSGDGTGLPPRRVPVTVTPPLASPPWGLIPPTSLGNRLALRAGVWRSPLKSPHPYLELAILGRRAQRWSGYSETGRMWWGQHTRRTAHAQELYKPEETWKRATLRYGGAEAGRGRTRSGRSGVPQAALPAAPKLNKTANPPLGGGE